VQEYVMHGKSAYLLIPENYEKIIK